jgi:hypothetical protein
MLEHVVRCGVDLVSGRKCLPPDIMTWCKRIKASTTPAQTFQGFTTDACASSPVDVCIHVLGSIIVDHCLQSPGQWDSERAAALK